MPAAFARLRRRFRRLYYGLLARLDVHVLLRWWDLRDLLASDPAEVEARRVRRRPLPGCERLELRWLMSSGVTEYTVGTSLNPFLDVVGHDNRIWFSEHAANAGVGAITTTGAFTNYSLGITNEVPYGVTEGSDQNVWFTTNVVQQTPPPPILAYVGKITTAGTVTLFSFMTGTPSLGELTGGPDGNLYVLDPGDGEVLKMTTAGSVSSTISVGGGIHGITSDPSDNSVWVTEGTADKVARIGMDGTVTEYSVPGSPLEITVGGDGNLWFSMTNNEIGRITPDGSTVSTFNVPSSPGAPYGLAPGPDGNTWFVEASGDSSGPKVAFITPAGAITEVATLTLGRDPQGICLGPDNLLWFAEYGASRMAKVGWTPAAFIRSDEPTQGTLVSVGPGLVAPGTGDYFGAVALDPWRHCPIL
jgi:virginiamycin B lyase